MSGETLRRAAALMRADAAKATPGRWKTWAMSVLADQDGTSNYDTAVPVADTFATNAEGRPRTFDADHIARFGTPAVALAVADWLDDEADYVETSPRHKHNLPSTVSAVAVTTAYLGAAS